MLPDNIHIIANGKLHISVTSVYSGENVLISNFTSKEELIGVSVIKKHISLITALGIGNMANMVQVKYDNLLLGSNCFHVHPNFFGNHAHQVSRGACN